MKNIPQTSDFSVCQKIYRRLLLAYPRAHRAEYGPAMAQLFRDQCRDAWKESRAWGLLKLWLRVLPDLVSTSILERLAALNERKSMTDKLANLFGFRNTPATAFFRVFVPVFVLVFGASVVITFILPKTYASTAQIMLESNAAANHGPPPSYDPYFIQTAIEVMRSQAVLDPVIEKLNLNEMWGKKYNNGIKLKTADTLQLLKQRLELAPRNTMIVSIKVYSEDRNEAAQIANAVMESYLVYRAQTRNELTANVHGLPKFVEIAKPGLVPARPNKPLNITLGAVAGIFMASVVGTIFTLFGFLLGKRPSKTVSVA